jgi:hypothetical protein
MVKKYFRRHCVEYVESIVDPSTVRHEIVFVSENVDGYEQIVESILVEENEYRQIDLIVLDRELDGVEQIGVFLGTSGKVDVVHIISHGIDGAVNLGSAWLCHDTLENYAGIIGAWQDSLTEGASVLLYGCNLAETEEGREFVENFSQLAGVDVAVGMMEPVFTASFCRS